MSREQIAERLAAVRRRMEKEGVQLLLVRSTDRYLNEYVPTEESTRVWLSGFTGSMGELLITPDRAYLAVDGRYWIQAEQETDPEQFTVLKVGQSTSLDEALAQELLKVASAAASKPVVGFEPDRISPAGLELLKSKLGDKAGWKPLFPSPVEAARGSLRPNRDPRIRLVDEKKLGRSVQAKLAELGEKLAGIGAEALLVQRLDEIAYLSNLRGEELPYQATFRAIALATPETLFVGIDPASVPKDVRLARDEIMFVPESELWSLMGKKAKRKKIAFDKSNNTEQARMAVLATGAEAIACESPLPGMKARKNGAELAAMLGAFARADQVVDEAQRWLCGQVLAKKKLSEKDFAEKVTELFLQSGARGLSFRVISAAGKNGAVVHYSDPSPRRLVKRGELLLLDTGAYYDEGYATDLTRTFLVDTPAAKGTAEQRRYYTLVLKAAIAGMTAVIPEGSKGSALDALVRAPLWAEGLNYNHGTGHGVGINVHEFPPRIGPGSNAPLEEGFVFSIEPGVYLERFGGIRIENLCTLDRAKDLPGFLRVRPLTFCPLDQRLIEPKLLRPEEKAWLTAYKRPSAKKRG